MVKNLLLFSCMVFLCAPQWTCAQGNLVRLELPTGSPDYQWFFDHGGGHQMLAGQNRFHDVLVPGVYWASYFDNSLGNTESAVFVLAGLEMGAEMVTLNASQFGTAGSSFQWMEVGAAGDQPVSGGVMPSLMVMATGVLKEYAVVTQAGDGCEWRSRSIFVLRLQDVDQDLLPDEWETSHVGTLGDLGAEPADFDGDGRSDLDEWLAGTDPSNAGSRFCLSIELESNGDLLLSWFSVVGRFYQVQGSNDLNTWADVGTAQMGDGSIRILRLPGNGAFHSYRVGVFLGE